MENTKQKFIFDFGRSHLEEFNLDPRSVALIIEANSEQEARDIVFNTEAIGPRFCTSYSYDYITKFIQKYHMKEYTLDELMKFHKDSK